MHGRSPRDPEALELARLVRASEHHADLERRSLVFMAQLTVALLAFGLTPLVPGAARIFGALSAPALLGVLASGLAAASVSTALFRRLGSASRVYRASEVVESAVMYTNALVAIVLSGVADSVLYILAPFTVVFWANAKPFWARTYPAIVAGTHGATALAFLARGGPRAGEGALVALAVGGACLVGFQVLASRGRAALAAEAQRNVLRRRLDAALLDAERARIAEALREGVGAALASLVAGVGPGALEDQARAALAELEGAASEPGGGERTVAEVGARMDERCRPLCVDAAYVRTTRGDEDARVDAERAHALGRVVQELVRNAVVHGRARRVEVVLERDGERLVATVRDDGAGLSADGLARATGGLENARRWLAAYDGGLELVPRASGEPAGTVLRAALAAAPSA